MGHANKDGIIVWRKTPWGTWTKWRAWRIESDNTYDFIPSDAGDANPKMGNLPHDEFWKQFSEKKETK